MMALKAKGEKVPAYSPTGRERNALQKLGDIRETLHRQDVECTAREQELWKCSRTSSVATGDCFEMHRSGSEAMRVRLVRSDRSARQVKLTSGAATGSRKGLRPIRATILFDQIGRLPKP